MNTTAQHCWLKNKESFSLKVYLWTTELGHKNLTKKNMTKNMSFQKQSKKVR